MQVYIEKEVENHHFRESNSVRFFSLAFRQASSIVVSTNYFRKAEDVSEEQIPIILENFQCFPRNILSFKYFNKSICK